MNVRFYMDRAQQGNKALMESFGLERDARAGRRFKVVQKDTYVRYHREQFKGSTLSVRGGVLKTGDRQLTLYLELANDEKAQVAATFILVNALVDESTRAEQDLPADVLAAAAATTVDLPDHGRPRTIELAKPRLDLGYQDLADRLGEDPGDPMSRRMERTIEAADCDEFGFLADTQDLMFGAMRMPRPDKLESFGPMTFVSDEGHRFGWASMETRNIRFSQPRAGDSLCSIGAEIGLHAKIRHSRRWMFNSATGALVSMNDNVGIALDLDARRSIEIPVKVRQQLERRHLPEFA